MCLHPLWGGALIGKSFGWVTCFPQQFQHLFCSLTGSGGKGIAVMRGCVSIETQVNSSIPTDIEINMSSGRKVLPLNDGCHRCVFMTNETVSTVLSFPTEKSVGCSVRYKGEGHRRETHSPHFALSRNVVPYRSQRKSLYIWVCVL